jgi:hypothetical protein
MSSLEKGGPRESRRLLISARSRRRGRILTVRRIGRYTAQESYSRAMASTRSAENSEPFVGYAFGFKNPTLGFDLFGSPHEILQSLLEQGILPNAAAEHLDTEITAQKVRKVPSELQFDGGDDVLAFMQLLDALVSDEWDEVKRLIAETPGVIEPASQRTGDLLGLLAAEGKTQFLEFLLRNGARTDSQGDLGMTALHWAAAAGQAEAAEFLLAEGAERSVRNWFLMTPAELASLNAQTDLARRVDGMARRNNALDPGEILSRMSCTAR